jgi:acyl carrier protein
MDDSAARALIADHLAVAPEAVTDDATFLQLGADSLDLVTLTMELEERFAVDISDEQATGCTRVIDALDALRGALLLKA